MTRTRRCGPLLPVLLLLWLTLGGCATPLRPSAPTPPPAMPPPPPAATATADSVTDWQSYSQKVEIFLRQARKRAADLLLPTPGCAHTSPRSADCL